MINYYIKYLELLDTAFLALKKKPLGLENALTSSPTTNQEQLSYMYSTTPLPLSFVIRN